MPQDTSFNISKEANKEINQYKLDQDYDTKSETVIEAIAKAKKYDAIKYANQ